MKKLSIIFMLAATFMLAGCNGSGSSGSASGPGTLSMSLTDTPQPMYKAVYVTIDEVQVHQGGTATSGNDQGWKTVATPDKTYDLLKLVNGVMEKLGISDLDSGTYTQVRLILGNKPDDGTNILGNKHPYANYLITSNDAVHELTTPSAYKTGIKLTHEFQMTKGLTVDLVLDFDVSRSIVEAGKSGQYILKPTIRVLETKNNAIVKGKVTDDQGNPLPGVLVTAQIYDAQAADAADQVNIAASTVTDSQTDSKGQYKMYVPPGTYNLTAYKYAGTDPTSGEKTAYGPSCALITTQYNNVYAGEDFKLSSSAAGTLQITIANSTAPTNSTGDVSISVRKTATCQDATSANQIEVTSLMVSGDNDPNSPYEINLPGGNGTTPDSYTVVAVDGTNIQTQTVDLSAGEIKAITFDFSTAPPT